VRGVPFLLAALTAFVPLAGCTTTQLAQGLQTSAEVCQIAQADGPVLVALADVNGVPLDASRKAAAIVQADCAAIGAVAAAPGLQAAPGAVVTLPPAQPAPPAAASPKPS